MISARSTLRSLSDLTGRCNHKHNCSTPQLQRHAKIAALLETHTGVALNLPHHTGTGHASCPACRRRCPTDTPTPRPCSAGAPARRCSAGPARPPAPAQAATGCVRRQQHLQLPGARAQARSCANLPVLPMQAHTWCQLQLGTRYMPADLPKFIQFQPGTSAQCDRGRSQHKGQVIECLYQCKSDSADSTGLSTTHKRAEVSSTKKQAGPSARTTTPHTWAHQRDDVGPPQEGGLVPDDGPGARLRRDTGRGHGVHHAQRALQVVRAAVRAHQRRPVPPGGRQATALHVIQLRAMAMLSGYGDHHPNPVLSDALACWHPELRATSLQPHRIQATMGSPVLRAKLVLKRPAGAQLPP